MTSIEDMKKYITEHNLTKLVRELNPDGDDTLSAIKYVYYSHTMSRKDFAKKFFGIDIQD